MIIKDINDTKKIAQDFLNKILKKENKNAIVVGLFGDLGVGKTHFTQAVGKILGIKRKINSPTFVIMKRYLLKHKNLKNLFHLDAYRLKNEKEILHLGWDNLVKDPKNLIFIEWPERVKKAMPKRHHQIHIAHTKEGHRKFKIKHI